MLPWSSVLTTLVVASPYYLLIGCSMSLTSLRLELGPRFMLQSKTSLEYILLSNVFFIYKSLALIVATPYVYEYHLMLTLKAKTVSTTRTDSLGSIR